MTFYIKTDLNRTANTPTFNKYIKFLLYLLFLDFQILLYTEVVTSLSHDQVALFKTFRGYCLKLCKADYQPRHFQDKTNPATTVRLTIVLWKIVRELHIQYDTKTILLILKPL